MPKKVSVCSLAAARWTFCIGSTLPVLLEIGLESEKTLLPFSSFLFSGFEIGEKTKTKATLENKELILSNNVALRLTKWKSSLM